MCARICVRLCVCSSVRVFVCRLFRRWLALRCLGSGSNRSSQCRSWKSTALPTTSSRQTCRNRTKAKSARTTRRSRRTASTTSKSTSQWSGTPRTMVAVANRNITRRGSMARRTSTASCRAAVRAVPATPWCGARTALVTRGRLVMESQTGRSMRCWCGNSFLA